MISTTTSQPSTIQNVAPIETYDVDASHSSAQFKVRHLMVSNVRGHLGAIEGTLTLDPRDPTRSHVAVKIDARGVDSKDAKRDEHLRSGDFFDVAQHPYVTFQSTAVRAKKGGELEVVGDLTIRGVTRPVTLQVESLTEPVRDPWGNVKRGATARTSLNRSDWGLTWNAALEAGGVLVGDRVDVEIEVELLRRKL